MGKAQLLSPVFKTDCGVFVKWDFQPTCNLQLVHYVYRSVFLSTEVFSLKSRCHNSFRQLHIACNWWLWEFCLLSAMHLERGTLKLGHMSVFCIKVSPPHIHVHPCLTCLIKWILFLFPRFSLFSSPFFLGGCFSTGFTARISLLLCCKQTEGGKC